jgi:hypothetical protein
MTDLIKRLRLQSEHIPVRTLFDDAADRIEELVKERDEYKEAAKVWQEDFIQENQRLYEAKVRLAVVVEERDQYKAAAEICGKAARAMLAELEGKK